MATLIVSVSGEPETGKTALLANIARALSSYVDVTWENPELPSKDNAKIAYMGDKIPEGTRVVLQEVYLPPASRGVTETVQIFDPLNDPIDLTE